MELLIGTFTALFSVVNPFGSIPLFVSLTTNTSQKQLNDITLKISLYMVGILVAFFFAGTFILDFFGIRIEDIRIAGGILIVRSSFQLLGSSSHKGKSIDQEVQDESMEKEDISFTPMAMPMLSGPGSIAVTIGMINKASGTLHYLFIVLSIMLVAISTMFILRSAHRLNSFLGKSGMAALSRMMGFLILSVGISFILNGILPLLNEIINK